MINFDTVYQQLTSNDHESKKEAIGYLYETYEKKLKFYIQIKYPYADTYAIEDIIQETFLSLLDTDLPSGSSVPHSQYAIVGWLKAFIFNKIRNDKRLSFNTKRTDVDGDIEGAIDGEVTKNNSYQGSYKQSNCIQEKIKAFGQKNDEGLSIFIEHRLGGSTQKQMSEAFKKSLSNIKKICVKVENELQKAIQPCIEN